MLLDWEQVDNDNTTYRLNVFGGWLVALHAISYFIGANGNRESDEKVTMCFVPDPGHTWTLH